MDAFIQEHESLVIGGIVLVCIAFAIWWMLSTKNPGVSLVRRAMGSVHGQSSPSPHAGVRITQDGLGMWAFAWDKEGAVEYRLTAPNGDAGAWLKGHGTRVALPLDRTEAGAWTIELRWAQGGSTKYTGYVTESAQYRSVRNLAIQGKTLSWDRPTSAATPTAYTVHVVSRGRTVAMYYGKEQTVDLTHRLADGIVPGTQATAYVTASYDAWHQSTAKSIKFTL